MTGETKLEPCPFCGGAGKLCGYGWKSWVRCPTGCETNGPLAGSAAEAIALWNTRTPDLQSKLDRATDALERSREGWENAVEMGLIPPQHVNTARILADEARATIAAIKEQQ